MLDYKDLLRKSYELAMDSRDPSTQNGAILVDGEGGIVASGVNNFPRGITESAERWGRPLKYKIVEHAERNAIYDAAGRGIRTAGRTMVCCWAPCCDCARAIINSGIERLVTHKQALDRSPESWAADIALAETLLREGGVEFVKWDGHVGAPPCRHSGQVWNP